MSNTFRKQSSSPPLLPRQPSITSLQNSSIMMSQPRDKSRLQIQNLLNKFNEINGQVSIDIDQKNFNLITYQKQNDKIKYDPQMMAAKLRKLQNRAEINRAQREIQNRQKKKYKRLTFHNNSRTKELVQQSNYTTIYKQFLQNNKLTEHMQQISDDQQLSRENKPKNIAYFSQLKRHPLLLQYTLQRISSKQKSKLNNNNKNQPFLNNNTLPMNTTLNTNKIFDSTLYKLRKQSSTNQVPTQYKQIMEQFTKKMQSLSQNNPQSIIQSRFSKFYSKKSSDKLTKQVRNIPRCSKMIEKQNQIVSQMDDNAISKENKQKLKSRLNQIITSIGKSQRIHMMMLPKLPAIQKQKEHRENASRLDDSRRH